MAEMELAKGPIPWIRFAGKQFVRSGLYFKKWRVLPMPFLHWRNPIPWEWRFALRVIRKKVHHLRWEE